MSNCEYCGNIGVRNGELCDCVCGIQERLRVPLKQMRDIRNGELPRKTYAEFLKELDSDDD